MLPCFREEAWHIDALEGLEISPYLAEVRFDIHRAPGVGLHYQFSFIHRDHHQYRHPFESLQFPADEGDGGRFGSRHARAEHIDGRVFDGDHKAVNRAVVVFIHRRVQDLPGIFNRIPILFGKMGKL